VKYMLLIFSNPGNPHFSGDELDAVGAEVGDLMGELAESASRSVGRHSPTPRRPRP
jgi:hypothetical protein